MTSPQFQMDKPNPIQDKMQKIFFKVKEHLLKQNRKASDSEVGSKCYYRGIDGTKCAVGILIPDEDYVCSMELCSVVHNQVRRVLIRSLRLEQYSEIAKDMVFELLVSLQRVHDNYAVIDWPWALKQTCTKYHLDYE